MVFAVSVLTVRCSKPGSVGIAIKQRSLAYAAVTVVHRYINDVPAFDPSFVTTGNSMNMVPHPFEQHFTVNAVTVPCPEIPMPVSGYAKPEHDQY